MFHLALHADGSGSCGCMTFFSTRTHSGRGTATAYVACSIRVAACCGQFMIPVGTEGGPCLASVARAMNCPQPCFSLFNSLLHGPPWHVDGRRMMSFPTAVLAHGCESGARGVCCTCLEACCRTRVAQCVRTSAILDCMGRPRGLASRLHVAAL